MSRVELGRSRRRWVMFHYWSPIFVGGSTRWFYTKISTKEKKVRREYKKEGRKRTRSRGKMLSRAHTCNVASELCCLTPAQALRLASAARPRSWLSWRASPIPNKWSRRRNQPQERVHQCGVGRHSRSRLLLAVEQNKLMSRRRVNRVYKAGIERSWWIRVVGCAGYLVGVVYLPLDMNAKWVVKVFTVHSAYEDVDPLCDADLASITVWAVFYVTRELEYEVVDWEIEKSGSWLYTLEKSWV